MNRIEENVYYDPSIKHRSFRIVLKRENFEEYRQQPKSVHIRNEICMSSECKIILSSSEVEEIMRQMSAKTKHCSDNMTMGN